MKNISLYRRCGETILVKLTGRQKKLLSVAKKKKKFGKCV